MSHLVSFTFLKLTERLRVADEAFDQALEQLGEFDGSTATERDRRKAAHLHRQESKTSDAADSAFEALCQYQPKSANELAEYLRIILSHERVAEMHKDISTEDAEHTGTILKNSHAAIVNLLLPKQRRDQ